MNRSRLRSKRSELYQRHASTNGNDDAEKYNDDDIYGEQEPDLVLASASKDEDLDMLEDQDYLVEEAEAWLCTCSEQGVFKVRRARCHGNVNLHQLILIACVADIRAAGVRSRLCERRRLNTTQCDRRYPAR